MELGAESVIHFSASFYWSENRKLDNYGMLFVTHEIDACHDFHIKNNIIEFLVGLLSWRFGGIACFFAFNVVFTCVFHFFHLSSGHFVQEEEYELKRKKSFFLLVLEGKITIV